jgi:arginase
MPQIKIIENASEIGAGTRGAGLGIGALKVAAHNNKNSFFGNFERFVIEDENELLNEDTLFKYAKRIDGLVSVYRNTSDVVAHVLNQNDFPLVLSGDHASAGGTIAGIKKQYPNKRLGVIWVDAHADLHTPYTTPSGNLHGMPLATVLNIDNLDNQINTPSEETISYWEELKKMGGATANALVEDVVFISVRDTEHAEDAFIAHNKIRNFSVDELRSSGMDSVVEEIKSKMSDCDIVYVSFDVDSMDCIMVSKGTGTPVENGLSPEEAQYFMNEFAKWEKVCCIEMVEINPCLDNKVNRMAEVAFDILDEFTLELEKRIK